MIRATGVTKRYGAHTVLQGVTLSLPAGVHVLLGPNGAGKSTLLRILAGLEAADAGSVGLCGLEGDRQRVEQLRTVGVLPDELGLFEVLSVEENLLACGSVYGMPATEIQARAHDLLRLFDLWQSRRTVVRQGSFGMRKKTALAMALLHRPAVLLLDEPFEGIDPNSTLALRALLRALADQGTAILLTSHLLGPMQTLADRVLLLRDGALALNAPIGELETGMEERYLQLVGEASREIPAWLRS